MVEYSKIPQKRKDEDDVRQFLSETLRRPIGSGPLQPLLSDGLLLCDLMEHISSDAKANRKENKSHFAYHDNIGQFLIWAEKLSIPQAELFQTVDLVDGKSMQSVFSCLLAIKRKIAEPKTSQLVAKSVSKQTVHQNSEAMLHKQQQIFPTPIQQQQQKELKKESFNKKNVTSNKSESATVVLDNTSGNGSIKNNTFEYVSTMKNQFNASSNDNISKYRKNQWKERSQKAVTSSGAVRSKIEMYNQPSPVEVVPRRSSTQLYFSKSSETAEENEKLKFDEVNGGSSPYLKVSNMPSSMVERNISKNNDKFYNQNLKKSGSSDTMLSVENGPVSLKSSKSTPLVSEEAGNHKEIDYKINQAAARKASLKQMGTNSIRVKGDDNRETVYALGRSIGKGQFGEVFGGLNMSTSEYVAIKRIKRNDMDCDDMNEVDFLKYLDSEHIVRYKGYSKDKEYLNIVLEYVEMGSLKTNIKCFGKFPENLAASHTYKILSGLKYLHDKQVIHCDLKAANILITKTGCLKLTDFGVSLFSKMKDDDTGEPSGTPNWMAPEVIRFNRPTEKSDIWSLGCTVVEMLTGKPPYSNMVSFAVLFKIVEDDALPIPENISEDARDFLLRCFQKDPKNRATAAELMQHKWLRHAITSITSVKGTVNDSKLQKTQDIQSVTKKVPRKEVKKDTVTSNKLYNRENIHQFYNTSTGKNIKMETCCGCLKTMDKGETKYCKECFSIYHNSHASKTTRCSNTYSQVHKSEPFKQFKNSFYSDSGERNDIHFKPIYPAKSQNASSPSYMHKRIGAFFP